MSTTAELEELGRRIRKLRIDRRMTLKQVESRSSLSATHLSEIERGRTSPTIGALIRIARSLDKHPSFFIETEELADVAKVPCGEGREFAVAPGIVARSLSKGIPGSELFAYRLQFGAPASSWELRAQAIPADALYFVASGSIEITIGEQSFTLSSGDAVQGSLLLHHQLRSKGDAEIIAVLGRPILPAV